MEGKMVEPDGDVMELLTGDLKRIAEVAGVEAAVRIARAFRGCFLYVPGLDEVVRRARDEMIKKDYKSGSGLKRLAIKYGLTERRLRMIVNSPSCAFSRELLDLLAEDP